MLLAAGHSWRPDPGPGRWIGALVATAVLHGGAVAAGLIGWQSIAVPTPPPAAIMLELAPLPVAPAAPLTQAAREAPPMDSRPEPLPEPAAAPEPPSEPGAAAALPMPSADPVPPTMREPEVPMPKPLLKKPVAQAVELPKEKPKQEKQPEKPTEEAPKKPEEKPKQQAKEKPKPETTPDPVAEPTSAQDGPPPPSQQAATAAAPVQQAAVAAAPSAADIARRADAEANWQGRLLAHLEKHKKYPKSARKRDQQGTSFLRFRMARNGTVLSYALARSSGFAALDEEVLEMIGRAQPLPALPVEMTEAVVEIVVPVQFTLR